MKWVEVNIGSIGEVVTGNTPLTSDREFYGGPYPFIKPTDMEIDRRHVDSWEETYSEKAFKKYKNAFIPAGATGVVTIGTVGEKLFQADQACFTNQSVNVVIPDREKYDADFVYYLMKYNLPQVSAANPGTASGRHHVSKSNFCAIKVNVPDDIKNQKRIASVLSAYDDLIENNLKRIKLLEEIAQRTYEEWFVKFRINGKQLPIDKKTGLPDGWEIKTLSELLTKLESGSRPKGGINKDLTEGIPSIGAESVLGLGQYNYSKEKLIPQEYYEKMRRGKVEQKDILIYKDGAYIGKTSMFQDNFPYENCVINEHVFLINTGNNDLQNYLFFTLNRKEYFQKMQALNSNAAQPGINQEKLNTLEVVVPKFEFIKNYSSKIEPNISLIFSLAKQNQHLKTSRDILLPRLMSGKIEVKE